MSTVDESKLDLWKAMQARHSKSAAGASPGSKGGDGEGPFDPMESRVAKLEAYMEITRSDTREIRGDLLAIIGKLGTLSTKADVIAWKWQWIAGSVALFAIIVGSIIGGLGWLAEMMKD